MAGPLYRRIAGDLRRRSEPGELAAADRWPAGVDIDATRPTAAPHARPEPPSSSRGRATGWPRPIPRAALRESRLPYRPKNILL